jgi:hypothetical protein
LAQQLGWSFVVTFKEGRTPALWREYQALLKECPENVLQRTWGDGREQTFRWVTQMDYADSLVPLLERGSLLRRLAEEAGRPVWKLFGSLKHVARRLLDSLRFLAWEESWFDVSSARQVHIGLDSS